MRSRLAGLAGPATGALTGLLSAGSALAVAELGTVAARPEASPILVVGQVAIDLTPRAVKEWAIRAFGTHDKAVLLAGVVATLSVVAVGVGTLARRHRWAGLAGVGLFGALGGAAAWSRPNSGLLDVVPSLLGTVAGMGVLVVLLRAARPVPSGVDAGVSRGRRRLLLTAVALTGGAMAVGVFGHALAGRRFSAARSRAAVRIPPPTDPAGPLPPGTSLPERGITPFVTGTRDFYRVDTALTVPQVRAETWELRVHGRVERPFTIRFADLLRERLIERDITLTCVSNEVGGTLAGTARWIGVPVADLLARARPLPGADQVVSRSADGMTIGTPTAALRDGRDAILAVAMNGEPLPLRHGFPVRMVVPGLYGYASACKWIVEMELTTVDAFDAYWVRRGWDHEAPIKTAARIDTPRPFARLRPGPVAVAGVAWAQHRRRPRRGPDRRRAVAPGPARPRPVGRHLAAVDHRLERHQRQPHPARPGHRRHRPDADRGPRHPVPERRHRLALDHVHRGGGLTVPAPRVSRAYQKSDTPLQQPSVFSGGMDHSASLSPPARRTRGIVLAGLAIVGVTVAAFVIQQPLMASTRSSSPVRGGPAPDTQAAPGQADGVVPDGVAVSVFDDEVPAVARLDPDLLDALRRAASDAELDGVEFRVNSGWRSPEYQRTLLRDAVAKYGSWEEAARWVSTPERSAHVTGHAVDLGPSRAAAWLSEHGAAYGLCQIYANEPWHYELRPDAVERGCPPMYADPSEDPRTRP